MFDYPAGQVSLIHLAVGSDSVLVLRKQFHELKEIEMELMKTTNWKLAMATGAMALATLGTPTAHAQCGRVPAKLVKPSSWNPLYGNARLMRAALDDESEGRSRAPIVGLWDVVYTATYDNNFPPGQPAPPLPFTFLESFKTWHADGTEFENAFLPPTGGNVCFGVWKDIGSGTVKLHHIGLMFNSTAGSPDFGKVAAIFTDDETVVVAPNGKTYAGDFDFRLWGNTYASVGVGSPIAEVKGTVAATRITVE